MKKEITNIIKNEINKWNKSDIYAISFYVDHLNDNPTRPILYIGYNTNEQVKKEIEDYGTEELEARWNYACWIQNELLCIGEDEDYLVKQWMVENGLKQLDDKKAKRYKLKYDEEKEYFYNEIDEKFMFMLAEVASDLHESGFIVSQFGREIPIIIHELEYYETIANVNKQANPDYLIAEFVKFCMDM